MKLEDRIKEYYEGRTKQYLMRRMITIIRLDGKGFSKYTNGLEKPFDNGFSDDMDATAVYLCENIQGAKFAYTQSDEISVVLTDFDNLETSAWFDYNVQKMVSIAASLATAKFNQLRAFRKLHETGASYSSENKVRRQELAHFDARVFQVPSINEMVNVMIWRQQDCTRNSISMAASANFSHGQLEGVSGADKQEMLFSEKGINWNDYRPKFKRGTVISKKAITFQDIEGNDYIRTKWLPDYNTPIFTQDKEYLTKFIEVEQPK
jgi:tRNA(His) guanylyltransferase